MFIDGFQLCTTRQLYNIIGQSRCHTTRVQDRSPRMSFILKGSQISTLQVKGWFKIQDINPRLWKWNTKLILNMYMNCTVHVSSTMVKNQESTIYILFLVVTVPDAWWFLWRADYVEDFKSSYSIWGCYIFWTTYCIFFPKQHTRNNQ